MQSSKMSIIHCSVVCNLKHWEKLKMPETWIQESLSGAFSWQRSWWVCSHHIFCGNCTSFSSPCQCTCTDLPTLGSNSWSSLLLGISGREIVRDQDACWTPICPGRINSTFQKKKIKVFPAGFSTLPWNLPWLFKSMWSSPFPDLL